MLQPKKHSNAYLRTPPKTFYPEKSSGPKADERAMEERKKLETVIGRHDTLDFIIRGWLLVLLGGLITARLSDKIRLEAVAYLSLSFLVLMSLMASELSVRVIKRRAIDRVAVVESALRKERPYIGPKISETLSSQYTGDEAYAELNERIVLILKRCGLTRASEKDFTVKGLCWLALMKQELFFAPVLFFYVPVAILMLAPAVFSMQSALPPS